MRSLKYLLGLLALVWCLTPANVMAQTATATSTSTATATNSPTATAPAAASTPLRDKITGLGFIGATQPKFPVGNGGLGGRVIIETATAALLLGQIVKPDTSNDNSVVVSTSGTTDPIGVVVGSAGTTAGCLSPGSTGTAPCTGQRAVIQVNGLALVACDRQMFAGQVVMTSTIANGDVGPYVAGTVDEQIGVMMSGCLVNGPGTMLIYK